MSFCSLDLFCKHIVRKNGLERISEEQMAEEFRRVYLAGLPVGVGTLKAVAAGCGIRLNELEKMPKNLRGYHEVYGDKKNIYFLKGDTLSGIQNTILHEMREMMETVFAEVSPGYMPLKTNARHIAANRFASAVLLPEKSFREKVYETGLDVVALSRFYSKSCAQVLLRMGEVLQGRLFFYAALYEPGSKDEDSWCVNYWTSGYNNEVPEANFRNFDGFLPRKGKAVVPGSLVDMAMKIKEPHVVRNINIFEDQEDDGLTAIARPLVDPDAVVTKVALVVLLAQDGRLLQPQVKAAKPIEVEDFHRHL